MDFLTRLVVPDTLSLGRKSSKNWQAIAEKYWVPISRLACIQIYSSSWSEWLQFCWVVDEHRAKSLDPLEEGDQVSTILDT